MRFLVGVEKPLHLSSRATTIWRPRSMRHETREGDSDKPGLQLTEAEHVGWVAEGLVEEHLWRHVLVCTADCHLSIA